MMSEKLSSFAPERDSVALRSADRSSRESERGGRREKQRKRDEKKKKEKEKMEIWCLEELFIAERCGRRIRRGNGGGIWRTVIFYI